MKAVAHKAVHELGEYVRIVIYLYVCLGAIVLYKAAILQGQGASYLPYGTAAIKALVLGKFILVGHAVGLGDRYSRRRPIDTVARKALLFLVMLLVLTAAEEVIIGLLNGRTIGASLNSLGGSHLQLLATSLLMLLILVPYLAFKELSEALGKARLREIMLTPRVGNRGNGKRVPKVQETDAAPDG